MLFSIMLILTLGFIGSKVFAKVKLPGLLGMISVGIIIGPYGLNLLDSSILNNSGDIRLIALVVILLRAGLGIDKETLKKVGKSAIKMSAIPCLIEGAFITIAAYKILNLSIAESGMLAFIIAAVSPAVVVPAMIELKEKGYGMDKGIPIIILAGASIDDIFAITLFTAFLGMGLNTGQALSTQLLNIPIEIFGGIILGFGAAYLIMFVYNFKKFNFSNIEKLCILLGTAFGVKILGDYIHVSGLLAIMTIGFVLLQKTKETAVQLEKMLNKIWFFAQIFLFVLIGAAVNTKVALDAGVIGVGIIVIGLIGRTLGVMFALNGSNLSMKERLFCAIAYSPKATVQAAIGGVPLAVGIASGDLILALAVLAIIITAPLGAAAIKLSAPWILNRKDEGLLQAQSEIAVENQKK